MEANGSPSQPDVASMADDSEPSRAPKLQRTRLISVSGDSCDFVEHFAPRISIKTLRAKVAASKNVKATRVLFCRIGTSPAALPDDEEVTYEVQQIDGRAEFRSTGEPLQMVLAPAVRELFTGRVKCKLDHRCEYRVFEEKSWLSDWVTVTMEQEDLGFSMNDEIRIFIGAVHLVCYGRLKDPHHRQLETWGNKDAGNLEVKVSEDSDIAGLHKLALYRDYTVERGDAKYGCVDLSELYFQEKPEKAAFVAAFREWERANPQLPL